MSVARHTTNSAPNDSPKLMPSVRIRKSCKTAFIQLLTLIVSSLLFIPSALANVTTIAPTSFDINETGSTMTITVQNPAAILAQDFVTIELAGSIPASDIIVTGVTDGGSVVTDTGFGYAATVFSQLNSNPCGFGPGIGSAYVGVEYQADGVDGRIRLYACDDMSGLDLGINSTIAIPLTVTTGATSGTFTPTYQGINATSTYTLNAVGPRYVATSDGVDTGDCTNSASPCATIGYGITQANEGETVFIDSGTYTEFLTINKAINLQGWADGGLGRTGTANTVSIQNLASFVIPPAATVSEVSITSVGLENDLLPTYIEDFTGLADGLRLDDVMINYDNDTFPVDCFNTSSAPGMSGLTIENSTIYDCGGQSGGGQSHLFNLNGFPSIASILLNNNTFEAPAANTNTTFIPVETEYTPKISSGTSELTVTDNQFNTGGVVFEDLIEVTQGSPTTTVTITDNTIDSGVTTTRRLLNIGADVGALTITGNTFTDIESSTNVISNCDPAFPAFCTTIDTLTLQNNDFLYTINDGLTDLLEFIGVTTVNDITGNSARNLGLAVEFDDNNSFTTSDNMLEYLDYDLSTPSAISQVTVEQNSFGRSDGTSNTLLNLEGSQVTVLNNILVPDLSGATDAAIVIDAGVHEYYNNDIIINNPTNGFEINSTDGTHTFRNNNILIQDDGVSAPVGFFCNLGVGDAETIIENNNVFFEGAAVSGSAIGNTGGSDCVLDGAGNISVNPGFTDSNSAYTSFDAVTRSILDSGVLYPSFANRFVRLSADGQTYYFEVRDLQTNTIFLQSLYDFTTLALDQATYGFVNFAKDADSSLVETGTATGAPATDFEGTVRPQGIGIDIGAFDTAAPVNTAPTTSITFIDGVDTGIGPLTNIAVSPQIDWSYNDADLDIQASYRVLICTALLGLNCDNKTTIEDSGNVLSTDQNYTLITPLNNLSTYFVQLVVSDGIDSTTSTAVSFTTEDAAATTGGGSGSSSSLGISKLNLGGSFSGDTDSPKDPIADDNVDEVETPQAPEIETPTDDASDSSEEGTITVEPLEDTTPADGFVGAAPDSADTNDTDQADETDENGEDELDETTGDESIDEEVASDRFEEFARLLIEDISGSNDGQDGSGDSDQDGLPDTVERLIGSDPNNPDTDGDGRNDNTEFLDLNTDPLAADTDFDTFMNPNMNRDSLAPSAAWTVAAPEGSRVTIFYEDKNGNRFELYRTEADKNGVAFIHVDGLPVGQDIVIITQITNGDGQAFEFRSKEIKILLPRLGYETDILEIIDGQRTRRILTDNKDSVHQITFDDPYLVSFTKAKIAKIHFNSLVFTAMVLSDGNRDQLLTEIPEDILMEPGTHTATLVAFDPETGAYDEPVQISFELEKEVPQVVSADDSSEIIVILLVVLLILLIASLILNVGLYASLKRQILEHEDRQMHAQEPASPQAPTYSYQPDPVQQSNENFNNLD